jgi:hypothetical protein
MNYSYLRGLTAILIIGLIGIVPLAIAETILDVSPDLITPFSSTTLEICQTAGSQDRLRNLTVTDPSGTVWWYSAAEGVIPWYCPMTYDVPFGSGSSGWTPNDGDSTQTDEEGTYVASVEYIDGNRQLHAFSVNEFTVNLVPEFALPSIILPAIALGSLALRNRIRQK